MPEGAHADNDALLDEVIAELEATRAACFVLDAALRLRWASSELHALMGAGREELGYGEHLIEALSQPAWTARLTPESMQTAGERLMPFVAAHAAAYDGPGAGLLTQPVEAEPARPPAMWTGRLDYVDLNGTLVPSRYSVTMLGHPEAGWIGAAVVIGSPLRATVLELLTRGDEQLFERMASLATPRAEPAAVMFVDIENSTKLSRRLSTAAYFELISQVLTTVDTAIARNDGIVGKHAGDGATGFFRASDAGSASAAARNAIRTAREVQRVVGTLGPEPPVSLNVGLHFAPRLYLGQLITSGRLEVTALGDEVNECARVQESSRGSAILATKLLLEQLDPQDAAALDIEPDATVYTPLSEWPTASDKARRDAAALPVAHLPS
ncbi:MAG: adenylate cyclase [Actinomycetota bacterium]|jgi:class 3 adenylate cyclase|nr:adenylate cyclase [Actinomycetota bacterium]